MRMRIWAAARVMRVRAAAEDGFTMLVALGVMTVVTLLVAAAFVAAQGDIHSAQHDLDGKRAYYAARAGINVFLYKLNQNTELWQNCPSQATTNVPGTNATAQYSYQPVPANGFSACSTSDPIHTMIDSNSGIVLDAIHRHVRDAPASRGRWSPASAARPRSTTSGTRSTRPSTRTPTRTRRTSRTARRSCEMAGRATAPGSTGSRATSSTARCTRRTSTRSAARRSSAATRTTSSRACPRRTPSTRCRAASTTPT